VFFDSEVSISKVVRNQTLEVNANVCVPVYPFVRGHSKIYIRNVPPFVPDNVVSHAFLPFG